MIAPLMSIVEGTTKPLRVTLYAQSSTQAAGVGGDVGERSREVDRGRSAKSVHAVAVAVVAEPGIGHGDRSVGPVDKEPREVEPFP